MRGELPAPFIPNGKEDNFDAKYANAQDPWKDENSEIMQQNTLLLRRNSIQNLFDGYNWEPQMPEFVKPSHSALTTKLEINLKDSPSKDRIQRNLSTNLAPTTPQSVGNSVISLEHNTALRIVS
jgi:hypothetical protein